jgi:glycyl-tRNA synthetase beta subunit
MASTKHRKNHKQKLAARNNRLAGEKSQSQKAQKEFIMNLIKQEQEKGLFENTQNINTIDVPIIDGPVIDGPSI